MELPNVTGYLAPVQSVPLLADIFSIFVMLHRAAAAAEVADAVNCAQIADPRAAMLVEQLSDFSHVLIHRPAADVGVGTPDPVNYIFA